MSDERSMATAAVAPGSDAARESAREAGSVGSTAAAGLRGWWRGLAQREQRLLLLAAVVLAFYALFALALQPAWRTLRSAPAELDRLEGQLQAMQRLAAEARELRAAPPVNPEQAAAALRAATERLGAKARLALQGDRAVLTLEGVASNELRDWLAEARLGARARPVEARLAQGAGGYTGTLVLAIGGGS